MPLRPTTVRFDHRALELVTQAAAAVGLSTSQFVREAALIRAVLVLDSLGRPLDDAEAHRWRLMAERVAELSRADGEQEV